MSPRIAVVIREDPRKSGRAVEALRIALGLAAGDNPTTVVLLNEAPWLLAEEPEDLVDQEILEKHLPVFKELGTPFVVEPGARARVTLDADFAVREAARDEIASIIADADRVLVF
ncbi:hypothetical protein [Candidatus Nitrospira bockiana]